MHSPRTAFTLVELMVVVALIAILLAMMMPALDAAMYQATLVQCSGNMKAVTNGGVIYAHSNKRFYPVAQQPRDGNGNPPRLLGSENAPARDLRLVFQKDGMAFSKLLVCPVSERFDISFEANDADTEVYSSYNIFFGWQYAYDDKNTIHGKQMSKIGDRFTCPDPNNPSTIYEHRTLIADQFLEHHLTGNSQGTHQDRNQTMGRLFHYQNGVEQADLEFMGVSVGGKKITISEWRGNRRSILDNNYGMDDGAVIRIDAERHDDRLRSAQPRRVVTNTGYGLRLPQ